MLRIDDATVDMIPDLKGGYSLKTVIVCHGHTFIFNAKGQEEFFRMYGEDADSSWLVQNMIEILPEEVKYSEVVDFVKHLGLKLGDSLGQLP